MKTTLILIYCLLGLVIGDGTSGRVSNVSTVTTKFSSESSCCCTLCGDCTDVCCGCSSTQCGVCYSPYTTCLSTSIPPLCGLGCYINNYEEDVEINNPIQIFKHSEPIEGVKIILDNNKDIWFSLHHVLLLGDCSEEIEAHLVKVGDVLCGNKMIININKEIRVNSYNTLTSGGQIKVGDVIITDKHKTLTSIKDHFDYFWEHHFY
jgi:hypothetical protein